MRTLVLLLSLMLFLTPAVVRAQPENQNWSDSLHPADWKVVPADGVTASIEEINEGETSFLRLHYSFDRGGGFVVLRRQVNIELADNFQISFDVRAEGPRQNLEIKLLDDAAAAAGGNVWWINRPAYDFPKQWGTVTQRRKNFGFAWGPDSKKPLKGVQAVEFAVASASGGKGHVDLRNLKYEPRAVTQPLGDFKVLQSGKQASFPITLEPNSSIDFELGALCEVGGIVLKSEPSSHPWLTIETYSLDRWRSSTKSLEWSAGIGYVASLQDCECAMLRLINESDIPVKITSARIHPAQWGDTPNHYVESLAKELPRGRFPRWANREQNYWTVCGPMESDDELLMSEDGAIELRKGGPTLEPFIRLDNTFLSWADARIAQHLVDDEIPLPQVSLKFAVGLNLTVTLIEDQNRFLARYEIENVSQSHLNPSLLLAARPFQILPPTQWLNMTGGVATISQMEIPQSSMVVDDKPVVFSAAISKRAATFAGLAQDIASTKLLWGAVRSDWDVRTSSFTQGLAQFECSLDPREKRTIIASIGAHADHISDREFDQAEEQARMRWRNVLHATTIQLPKALADIEHTIRAQQAYILINQDGNGTQPGSRTYERSWIRDGALTSLAMLRLGHTDFAKRFLDWYATYQYDNGKIPCVVDKRGSDPVDEHDSTGEYLFAVSQYFEYTHDREFFDRHWPHVKKSVEYLQSLIAQRSGDLYKTGAELQRAMYGLVPESISHEGYSSKPMHSYWDCFFTSRGLHDAAKIAESKGEANLADAWALAAQTFDSNLANSISKTQTIHKITYIPGCVELGDFDATSTAIGVWPCDFLNTEKLAPSLNATLDRYTEFFNKRAHGELDWKDYTPYELRLVGVIATQRDPEFALQMLRFFMGDQRPQGWHHWAEVVGRDLREPRFIGDMPHTWCGTEFLNSVLNMFILESREGLTIGAGIPWSIFEPTPEDPNPTLTLERVNTHMGPVSLRIARSGQSDLSIAIQLPEQFPKGSVALLQLPSASVWEVQHQQESVRTNERTLTTLQPGQNSIHLHYRTAR